MGRLSSGIARTGAVKKLAPVGRVSIPAEILFTQAQKRFEASVAQYAQLPSEPPPEFLAYHEFKNRGR